MGLGFRGCGLGKSFHGGGHEICAGCRRTWAGCRVRALGGHGGFRNWGYLLGVLIGRESCYLEIYCGVPIFLKPQIAGVWRSSPAVAPTLNPKCRASGHLVPGTFHLRNSTVLGVFWGSGLGFRSSGFGFRSLALSGSGFKVGTWGFEGDLQRRRLMSRSLLPPQTP